MRILVISDSHGMPSRILDAVEAHPEAEALIFLGDGESDIEMLESYCRSLPSMIRVAGNCDFSSKLPLMRVPAPSERSRYRQSPSIRQMPD